MIHIIATGYNCGDNVKKLYNSVKIQTVEHRLWLISDGSTDDTDLEVASISSKDGTVIPLVYPENKGAAFRRDLVISLIDDEKDIIVLVGLDDELLPNALEEILEQYKKGKWMTYGNWIDQWGNTNMVPLLFDEPIHTDRLYRTVQYRSTAPNSFYKFLYDRIPKTDLQLNGKWLDTTTESEVMFSCLEMCGKEKIGIIDKPIYLYNTLLANGTQKRLGQAYKNQVYSEIIKRPKKELLRGLYESM